MSQQSTLSTLAPRTIRTSGGWMAILLGVGAVLYVLLAAGCAAYLLWKAYDLKPGMALGDFNKLAIAALIAVVGTGMTGLASVYSATRQSATAYQVAEYNGIISRELTDMKASSDKALAKLRVDIDASLAEFKAASDETLARLKVALDARQIAYRELYGNASVYFYALRSAALKKWDDESLTAAEAGMISTVRHTINVSEDMRDQWFAFWQRAQYIYRTAIAEADADKRQALIKGLIEEKGGRDSLRDTQARMEHLARSEIKDPASTHPAPVVNPRV